MKPSVMLATFARRDVMIIDIGPGSIFSTFSTRARTAIRLSSAIMRSLPIMRGAGILRQRKMVEGGVLTFAKIGSHSIFRSSVSRRGAGGVKRVGVVAAVPAPAPRSHQAGRFRLQAFSNS